MKVYIDTSALLPLVHRDDLHHAEVVSAVRSLMEVGAHLVTSSYTLVEAGALVRRRLGVPVFRALGSAVDRAAEIVWIDEEMHRRAWRESALAGRDGPSLVDCASFLVMESMGIETALALDQHFRDRGFRTMP